MEDIQLLIGGERSVGRQQRDLHASQSDHRRGWRRAPRRIGRRCEGCRRCRRRRVPDVVGAGPQRTAPSLHKAAESARGAGAAVRRARAWPRPAPRAGWGHLQRASRRRHAARSGGDDHADRGRGHPVGRAGHPGDGHAPAGRRHPRHRAVECADHPRRARDRDAAGVRQHRDPQGVGSLPGARIG